MKKLEKELDKWKLEWYYIKVASESKQRRISKGLKENEKVLDKPEEM